MPDRQPPPRPVTRRPDMAAGDLGALVDAGRAEPPPQPRERPAPPPVGGSSAEQAHKVMLDDALTDAGLTQAPADMATVAAVARLDTASVAVIARWIRRPRTQPPPDPRAS